MTEREPQQIIAEMVAERGARSDREILAELIALPPLADDHDGDDGDGDSCWDDEAYWLAVAYPYLALAEVAATRKLRAAIRPLLDRACDGDPGEIMRGLRHALEAIVDPDWTALADICLAAIESGRPGTVLWATAQLITLDDPRAVPVLKQLTRHTHPGIRDNAYLALGQRPPRSN